MALADIVDTDDINTELGGAVAGDDLALLDTLRQRVERVVRNYVRWNITEATYIEILPYRGPIGSRLQLTQPFVTAVASVYEDFESRGGQGDNDFPASTLLTAGTDYWIDRDHTSYSREGILHRYGSWPDYSRTVKVTYTAGFDADALADEFLYVKDAVINETIDRFHYRKGRQGTAGVTGTIKSEKLKDYSVSYAVDSGSLKTNASGLSDTAEASLSSIMFYGMML